PQPPTEPEPVPTGEPVGPATGTPEPAAPSGPPGYDTHEITSWSPRTSLDHLAVSLGAFVRKNWAWVAVAYLAFAAGSLGLAILATFAANGDLLGPFILMITISLLPFLILLIAVRRMERASKEPVKVIFATFLLGAILAEIARATNIAFEGPFQILGAGLGTAAFFFLVVGPVEEFSKWAAVRFYAYERPEFDEVLDGAVYGIAAGAGFAWWENWTYISNTMIQTLQEGITEAGNLEGALTTTVLDEAIGAGWAVVIVRGIGFLGHPIWAGISGYYLGLAKFNPEHRASLIAKGLLIPVVLHASFNSLLLLPGMVLAGAEDDPNAQAAAGSIALLVFLIDFVVIIATTVWLFRKMKKNNRYLRAKRLWEAQAVATATAPTHLAGAVDMHPAADLPTGAPSPVSLGAPPQGLREAVLHRLAQAREHVTVIGRRARDEGRAEWYAWARESWEYLNRAEAHLRATRDEGDMRRIEAQLAAQILAVRYPPPPP
ncbi:MAG TPA: PrsW family intramembrane metalloprotease, partial [Candidatus Thermoplasmatota archaeon]|nr:PrsW family intramembrane metalloprotease [Candidatus Thermoplasmatota archaeon]